MAYCNELQNFTGRRLARKTVENQLEVLHGLKTAIMWKTKIDYKMILTG